MESGISAIYPYMNTIFTATRATWPMLADMQDQLQLAPSTLIPADLSPFCLLVCLPLATVYVAYTASSFDYITLYVVHSSKTVYGNAADFESSLEVARHFTETWGTSCSYHEWWTAPLKCTDSWLNTYLLSVCWRFRFVILYKHRVVYALNTPEPKHTHTLLSLLLSLFALFALNLLLLSFSLRRLRNKFMGQ